MRPILNKNSDVRNVNLTKAHYEYTLTPCFIQKYAGALNWSGLAIYQNLTDGLINTNFPLIEDDEDFWFNVSEHQMENLSLAFFLNNIEKIEMSFMISHISQFGNLSNGFISQYQTVLDKGYLYENENLDSKTLDQIFNVQKIT